MRFALDDEQRSLDDTLERLLSRGDVPKVARAWTEGDPDPGLELWRRLADVGATGLLVPEAAGGLGASAVEMVVALEAVGRHAAPGPWVETVFLTALVADLPALDSRDEVLAAVASGTELVTAAAPPWTPYALDADAATRILLVDAGGLHVGRPGDLVRSVDPARRLFPVTSERRLVDVPDVSLQRAMSVATLACSAQLLGLGEALLEASVAYVKQRRQFGRPVGEYQALKHALADVRIDLDFARPLVLGAAVTGASRDASAAKVAPKG